MREELCGSSLVRPSSGQNGFEGLVMIAPPSLTLGVVTLFPPEPARP